jgi:hypothetical protein
MASTPRELFRLASPPLTSLTLTGSIPDFHCETITRTFFLISKTSKLSYELSMSPWLFCWWTRISQHSTLQTFEVTGTVPAVINNNNNNNNKKKIL